MRPVGIFPGKRRLQGSPGKQDTEKLADKLEFQKGGPPHIQRLAHKGQQKRRDRRDREPPGCPIRCLSDRIAQCINIEIIDQLEALGGTRKPCRLNAPFALIDEQDICGKIEDQHNGGV